MGNMNHVDSMTVVGTRLPVENNTPLYFGEGYYDGYDSITDMYRNNVSAEWYHALNEYIDYLSYCEYIGKPTDIDDLLDKNGNVKPLSEREVTARKDIIKNHLDEQKLRLTFIEGTDQWKFLSEPEKYPYKAEIITYNHSIKKVYKTPEARDNLLVGYNENWYQENFNDTYKYADGDEGDLDRSARQNIFFMKYLHGSIINAIDTNKKNLNKLEFAQSSVFAIPSPNVPILPHGIGSNTQVTSTANSNLAQGVENTLGNIRDGLAETFDCSFGISCSNDLDKAAKNPNVGKNLSNSDKVESGGAGAGGPEGWEPDNENSPGSTHQVFSSIKDSPQYPKGFRSTQNGTTKNIVNNKRALEEFRKIESGKWHKVYKDGYDLAGNKVSVHYFQSQSGRVINVKVKPGWSNM